LQEKRIGDSKKRMNDFFMIGISEF